MPNGTKQRAITQVVRDTELSANSIYFIENAHLGFLNFLQIKLSHRLSFSSVLDLSYYSPELVCKERVRGGYSVQGVSGAGALEMNL